jgi:excisionase family DNA binding protein
MTTDDLPDVLTVDETARLLRISRGLAYAGVRDGSIPTIRVGRRILVPRDALLRSLSPRSHDCRCDATAG